MRRRILISSLILLVIPAFAQAATLRVPRGSYTTIQAAIDAANHGDTIVVDPGTYRGSGNRDLRFYGKDITVKSIINPNVPLEPEDWQTVANTIIDCQASGRNPHRAFMFSTGDNNCEVIGFTIINGHANGGNGLDGQPGSSWAICYGPEYLIDPADPLSPPRACEGNEGLPITGDGYGGAILCTGNSSPTIKYCIIKNCTVTGAQGGNGANGMWGVWYWNNPDPNIGPLSTEDGQWGGHGSTGNGNGYGGAIACIDGGSPLIESCTIRDNIAKGGIGGNGGSGGRAAGIPPDDWDGYESGSGDGARGRGDGVGGAIYCSTGGNPIIKNCSFTNNIARQGQGGQPGSRGLGNLLTDQPETMDPLDGTPGESEHGSSSAGIHGGAIFFDASNTDLTGCEFSNNMAYIENQSGGYFWYDYKVGGALFCKDFSSVEIDSCDFTNNKAGAVCLIPSDGAIINISNFDDPNRGLFSGNTEAPNGGAVCIGSGAKVGISNCSFAGNWAYDNGGALYCLSDLDINKCSFGGNKADYYSDDNGGNGGAIDASGVIVNMFNCSFASNQAIYGGGVHFENFESEWLENCHFFGNTAESGGGLSLINGAATITGGSVKNNTATYMFGFGGGIDCVNTELEISDCDISVNSAEGDYGFGGGISLDGGPIPHLVRNCLLTNNSADSGGAISCTYSEGLAIEIESSTFYSNSAASYGGGVFVDYDSNSTIINSIFSNCSNGAIYEEDGGGQATVKYSLFFDNPNGDYYDSGTGQVYNGPGDLGSIPGSSDNEYGNPLFIDPVGLGPNDDFLLSQIPLQGADSPALGEGSVNLSDPGFDPSVFGWDPREYTTRTDGAGDDDDLDMGFHYKYGDVMEPPRYTLTPEVLAGSGSIEVSPDEPDYPLGTVVNLTAVPTPGWFVKAWHGTDDDSLTGTTNTVTMTFHRTVGIEFRQKRTFSVGIDPNYPNIQSAIHDAEDGDVVVVSPGIWKWDEPINIYKSITLRAVDPNDPTATVIDRGRYPGTVLFFGAYVDSRTVLDGFTIESSGNYWWVWDHGEDAEDAGENGQDGGCTEAGGIYVGHHASPTIRNCIIKGHQIAGGNSGEGVSADSLHNAGRGGWGGWARGSGIYCAAYSSPKFINCQIIDNEARGGDGNIGGDWIEDGGWGNYGGNWSTAPGRNYDIPGIGWVWEEGNLWEVWVRHEEMPWWDDFGMPRWDYIGDYRWYTAYGGGVYCSTSTNVTFIDCAISGNRTSGGNSGEGGHYSGGELDRLPPRYSYQLPSYGAGVYCAADSNVAFINSIVTDNIAQEPNEHFHLDPYLGHGGGICAEDSATVTIENCLISGNIATVGGGVMWDHSGIRVIDSTIRNNKAYQGGGMGGVGGPVYIIGSTITNNKAFGMVTDPNAGDDLEDYDPNRDYYLPGDGGGIFCDTTQAHIIDCNISDNIAGAAGGGIYFTGETTPSLFNCLLRNNRADKGGGGVAAHYLAQPTIANCTITKNQASGDYFDLHYGGGLYTFDNANTSVINSIFWGNSSGLGPQIAIGQAPAGVDVAYSNVQGGAVGVFIDTGCTLNWNAGNLEGTTQDNPDFVSGDLGVFGESGGFFLAQLAGEGDPDPSPCVNRGSGNAHELGMYRHTTRTDGLIDGYDYTDEPNAIVDVGYHYILRSNLAGDFNYDGVVDGSDMERLLDSNLHWLEEGCRFPDYCHGKDLDKDGRVNFRDYAIFAKNYKAWEKIPPQPDPMTWETPPFSLTSTSIKMVATEATDNSTVNIEYEFKCVFNDDPCDPNLHDHSKDWSLDRIHIDTAVKEGFKYGYKVWARDESGNETGWSFVGYAIAGETPPDEQPPSPISWEKEPYGSAENAISMEAAVATDESGPVEYLFQFIQYIPDPVVYGSSGWQSSRTWTYQSDGLDADSCYCCFRFKARDAEFNESNWSSELIGCTLPTGAGEDITPPITPLVDIVNQDPYDPYQAWFAVWPYETTGEWHYMQAVVATDETGPVWYYFERQAGNAPDSGWQLDTIYTFFWNSPASYRVRTTDSVPGSDPPVPNMNPSNIGNWSPAGYTGSP